MLTAEGQRIAAGSDENPTEGMARWRSWAPGSTDTSWSSTGRSFPRDRASATSARSATDSRDRVYVFQRKDPPVLVFERDGTYLTGWGIGNFANPHGIYIANDVVYLTDREDSVCLTYTLDGRPLQVLGIRGQHSDTGCERPGELVPRAAGPFNYPTEMVPSPSGELYVTDGYRNARVHRFSAAGQLIASWGQGGKTGAQSVPPAPQPGGRPARPDLRVRSREQPHPGLLGRGRLPGDVDRSASPARHLHRSRRDLLHQRGRRRRPVAAGQPDGPGRRRGGALGFPLGSRELDRRSRRHLHGPRLPRARRQVRPAGPDADHDGGARRRASQSPLDARRSPADPRARRDAPRVLGARLSDRGPCP